MLAEIGELLVNMAANVSAIHDPDLEVATLINFL
jgi:hypothetical protein